MTVPPIIPLLACAIIVLVAIYIPIEEFMRWLYRISRIPYRRPNERGVPALFVGSFERIMAFSLVALGIQKAYTIMAAWLAAKLAASWQRIPVKSNEQGRRARAGTLIALILGIVSVTLGLLVGHAFLWLLQLEG